MKILDIDKLIKNIRLLSDQRESEYVSDDEIIGRIETNYYKLYMDICNLSENYFLKSLQVKTDTEGNFELPRDFKSLVLIREVGGFEKVIATKDIREVVHDYNDEYNYDEDGAFLLRDKVKINSSYNACKDFILFYVPQAMEFKTKAEYDEINVEIKELNDSLSSAAEENKPSILTQIKEKEEEIPALEKEFQIYLEYAAANDISVSENVSNSVLFRKAMSMRKTILESARKRTDDFTHSVIDVDGIDNRYYEYF